MNNIHNDENVLNDYINDLNSRKGCTLKELIDYANSINNGVECQYEQNINDKGKLGKIVEEGLFHNKPNSSPKPDLPCGYDIKATQFKKLQNGCRNAKERLTITNVGTSNDYTTFDHLINSEQLEDSDSFKKMNFVLFYFDYNKNTPVMDKLFLGAIMVNFNEIRPDIKEIIYNDYKDIQYKIRNKCVSQTGQKYLHIHPHGSRFSKTRALGFKNKLVTILFGQFMNIEIQERGNSVYINI